MKGTSFRQLTLREFDVEELKKLTREGRVYVSFPVVYDENAYKREILEYVRSISCFATDLWKADIDDLWQQIVEDTRLRDCLVMKKGASSGHMNRYTITNIVCRLQNREVYRQDVPLLTLHLRLEGTAKKNKYYLSSGNYCLKKEEKQALNSLLQRV